MVVLSLQRVPLHCLTKPFLQTFSLKLFSSLSSADIFDKQFDDV